MKIHRQPLLAICGVILLFGDLTSAVASSMITLTPVPGSNTLNIAITANGTVSYSIFSDIPINSTSSQTAQLGGTQPLFFDANFDPVTQQGTITGLDFTNGNISVLNPLSWTLNLGTYLFIALGSVNITGANITGQLYTPHPMSLVSGGTAFPLADHDLILDGGTLQGAGTGVAANFVTPFTNNLATTPIQGPLAASGNGTVTLSNPTLVGGTASYTVTVTLPANSSYLVQTNPVDVTAVTTGTTRWQGTFTRLLLITNSITAINAGVPTTVTAFGLSGYNYVLDRATNLFPASWVEISTNAAATNGMIQAVDHFTDLGGIAPASAYYRFKWPQ